MASVQVSAFDSATRADLKPYWELDLGSSPERYIINILPENFEANVNDYNEFIKYYGTHFLQNARVSEYTFLVCANPLDELYLALIKFINHWRIEVPNNRNTLI